MVKIIYIDCETTGRFHWRHGIISLSAIMEIDGEVKEEIDLKMRPFDCDEIDEEALKINGYDPEEILTFPEPGSVLEYFKTSFLDKYINKFDKTDKAYPCAYCGLFDLDFLSSSYRKAGDKYGLGSYINWRLQDPIRDLHRLDRLGLISLENYKLETVCEYFGIKIDKAHESLSDVRALRLLDKKICEVIKIG